MPSFTQNFPAVRLRRLRGQESLRQLIQETTLSIKDFIFPLFIREEGKKRAISSIPGHFQLTLEDLSREIDEICSLGIPGVLLFGIPARKDPLGSSSCDDTGIIQKAIRLIKLQAPQLLVITDNCFCDYTDHGHCGVIKAHQGNRDVDNDATLELLALQALSYAKAGADIIAPSGMIDGMVSAIRKALDQAHFEGIPILSYSAKYASSLYSAFREAAESTPQFGDRKTYQMDPANGSEALREVGLDLAEGADMVMVKPALSYLDVIYRVRQNFPGVPIATYHVAGEYGMIKAAAAQGWIDEKKIVLEQFTSLKRAGAHFIINYYCKQAAEWIKQF